MEEDVKMRIRELLADYQSNPTQLSKRFGVNQKTLNSQINDSTTLSASTILLILQAFPEVSAEWLLRGVGEIRKEQEQEKRQISAEDMELVALSRDLIRVVGKIMDKANKK